MPEGIVDTLSPTETPQPSEGRIIKDGNVLLFRYENPAVPNRHPNSDVSHPDLVGNWFTDDPNSLKTIILMRSPGGHIAIVAVPEDKLADLHVSKHPIAGKMDVENDNYIVPNELLADARRIKFDVKPSVPNKFNLVDMIKIREFVDRLVEAEKNK